MDKYVLKELLTSVKEGKLDVNEAMETLKKLPFEDLGYAKVDHHRSIRTGFPEVVFCQGKTTEQVAEIFNKLSHFSNNVLATRATSAMFEAVKTFCPECNYHVEARCITLLKRTIEKKKGTVLVITGGTADIPVAEEASVSAEIMGNEVVRLFDVGVAGIHRLLHHQKLLNEVDVIIVVAGMEGALASVVGGLVDKPVIAVPTSIGYGASFNGLAALLAMLNSCASGVGVVNIDNGYGAAALADAILRVKGAS